MSGERPGPNQRTAWYISVWYRLVAFGFSLLYHELAWAYDFIAWLVSLGQWREWGTTALPYIVGQHILELGHGPGHLLATLTELGFLPVGLDASPQMTRIAHRRLRRAGLASFLVQGHTQELPFPSRTFDSVLATFPTAYITDPATLSEIARVLKPGGRLIAVMNARLTEQEPISRFLEWLYLVTGQRESIETKTLETLFAAVGLSMRHVQVEAKRSRVWLLIAEYTTPRDRDLYKSG